MGRLSDRELIEELCEIEEGLTGWEVEFVESVSRRYSLSDRQRAKAEEILEEKG